MIRLGAWLLAGGVLLATSGIAAAQEEQKREAAQRGQAAVEVLREGPVHEAFAKALPARPQIPPAAEQAPPAPLHEERPEIAPELAEQAVWIRGYWRWDADQEDFVWISGVWRFPPPGHRWIPTRWVQTDAGPRRIEGFWVPQDVRQVALLPEPPAYPEAAKAVQEAPSGHFWVPGAYVAADGRYQWRDGFAAPVVDNWEFVPAHHVWTDRGWVFIDGYWDYPLEARGQAFAALDFPNDDYTRPDFRLLAAYPVPLDAITRTDAGWTYRLEEDVELADVRTVSLVAPAENLVVPAVPAPVAAAPRTGVIRGVVNRGRLTPANILVHIEGTGIPPARTDDRGRFEFRDVPYGEYTLVADGAVQNIIRHGMVRVQVAQPVVDRVVIPLE